jgi:ketosteroid isomerase-like protein
VIDARGWLERYAAAWRTRDAAAAAALFAPEAHYTSDPFGPGLRGTAEIEAYWAAATAGQEDIDLRVGDPVAEGDRAAAEWRAAFRRDGEDVSLAACLMLRFDADGRCVSLREYWLRRAPVSGR